MTDIDRATRRALIKAKADGLRAARSRAPDEDLPPPVDEVQARRWWQTDEDDAAAEQVAREEMR